VSNTRPLLRAVLPVLILAGATIAQAQAPDSLAARLKRCSAVADANARLACYDALAGADTAAPAAHRGNPVSGDTAAEHTPSTDTAVRGSTAAAAPPATPSAAPPATPPAAPPATPAAVPNLGGAEFGVRNGPLEAKLYPIREKRMLAVVSSVSTRARGELVVRLDNDQVWVQLQPSEYPLKPGDHVEIDVGALGSYVLWCPSSRRATKVTRIN
jgi:hypothetical protein